MSQNIKNLLNTVVDYVRRKDKINELIVINNGEQLIYCHLLMHMLELLNHNYKDKTIAHITEEVRTHLLTIININEEEMIILISKETIFNKKIETNSDILIACLAMILNCDNNMEIHADNIQDNIEDNLIAYLYMNLLYISTVTKMLKNPQLYKNKIEYLEHEFKQSPLDLSSLFYYSDNHTLSHSQIKYIINILKFL